MCEQRGTESCRHAPEMDGHAVKIAHPFEPVVVVVTQPGAERGGGCTSGAQTTEAVEEECLPTWLSSMTGCKQSLTMATRLQLCPSLAQMTGLIGGHGLGKETKQSGTVRR